VVDWQQTLEERWHTLRLGEVTVTTDREHHTFEAQLFTGDLDPNSVRVELYADGANEGAAVRVEMTRGRQLEAAGYVYDTQWCRISAMRRFRWKQLNFYGSAGEKNGGASVA
jgi:starch phosphorylase